jgi:hypothetical protein
MSRGKRYTEDQIVKVLQEIEAGASIAGVAHLMYKPSTSASEYVAIAKCPWNVDGRAEWDSGKGQWNREHQMLGTKERRSTGSSIRHGRLM